ncbi:MAG: prepilin-type N-terminal cleavage/methylation domain-containing protein [Xanthomonadaceae bacterium]|nr:prepilin-type N-terminal cleavage/methylation domain-containing protein [Xanthomonadaceae bacterium]
MQQAQRPQHGFTLTELLVALAIAGVLAMIGAPAMGKLLAHVEDANTEASVAASLRHARTAAVMRNTRILVARASMDDTANRTTTGAEAGSSRRMPITTDNPMPKCR